MLKKLCTAVLSLFLIHATVPAAAQNYTQAQIDEVVQLKKDAKNWKFMKEDLKQLSKSGKIALATGAITAVDAALMGELQAKVLQLADKYYKRNFLAELSKTRKPLSSFINKSLAADKVYYDDVFKIFVRDGQTAAAKNFKEALKLMPDAQAYLNAHADYPTLTQENIAKLKKLYPAKTEIQIANDVKYFININKADAILTEVNTAQKLNAIARGLPNGTTLPAVVNQRVGAASENMLYAMRAIDGTPQYSQLFKLQGTMHELKSFRYSRLGHLKSLTRGHPYIIVVPVVGIMLYDAITSGVTKNMPANLRAEIEKDEYYIIDQMTPQHILKYHLKDMLTLQALTGTLYTDSPEAKAEIITMLVEENAQQNHLEKTKKNIKKYF
ncbi:hypothetical protein AAIR98_000958 [Elusimicrobium simillimum]|uniref:hypothetical protein n=1 Tax=Elusimicrobium simillimum TaxID=3143438 RepID=UPI003C704512